MIDKIPSLRCDLLLHTQAADCPQPSKDDGELTRTMKTQGESTYSILVADDDEKTKMTTRSLSDDVRPVQSRFVTTVERNRELLTIQRPRNIYHQHTYITVTYAICQRKNVHDANISRSAGRSRSRRLYCTLEVPWPCGRRV